MSTQEESRLESTLSPLEQYASYPFTTDPVYQQGLESILANNPLSDNASQEERDEISRRTRLFYFNKIIGNALTIDEVKVYEESQYAQDSSGTPRMAETASQPAPVSSERPNAEESRVLTFAQLKELIESGRLDEIPNNKTISSALHEAPPSQSTTQTRKKPWEIVAENQEGSGAASLGEQTDTLGAQ